MRDLALLLRRERGRTRPDRVLHDPAAGRDAGDGPDWDDPGWFWLNENVRVRALGDGLLATWTSGRPGPYRARVVAARSPDGGRSWSPPRRLDGAGPGGEPAACWQVPLRTPHGLAVIYSRALEGGSWWAGASLQAVTTGDGAEWSPPRPVAVDAPPAGRHRALKLSDAVESDGRTLVAATVWECPPARRHDHALLRDADSWAVVYEVAWRGGLPVALAEVARVGVPCGGRSLAQEPYLVALPGGALLMTVRTGLGAVYGSVSPDGGGSWRPPAPLRDAAGGAVLRQGINTAPVFPLAAPGSYVLLHNDNDGFAHGATGRWDVRNRRPLVARYGRWAAGDPQQVAWSGARTVVDNDGVALGPAHAPRLEAGAYPDVTLVDGRPMLWYADRKVFLLGRWLPPEASCAAT